MNHHIHDGSCVNRSGPDGSGVNYSGPYGTGPRFPKASLAYVVCEVHRMIIIQSDRFPIANDGSRGTRRALRASLP